MGRAGTPPHWSVRYRHQLAAVRVGALVAAAVVATLAAEAFVLLTAAARARTDELLASALTTGALAALPAVVGGPALLWIRRSALNYRQLITETCCCVMACDLVMTIVVTVALLR
ncbi:hypothetical protein KIH74_17015 [Kineosporia sp. J2-2]|uniref:Uncharacterized protein n=1 Tax=Kineosporia corallincola TaxID=2835133 RepID=A0ABS5THS7_9ACTN|nr:hypothetical protein [Kineosporia corallincola]MBT0770647.1 hypothetical protein [Kineosporia corallincola]